MPPKRSQRSTSRQTTPQAIRPSASAQASPKQPRRSARGGGRDVDQEPAARVDVSRALIAVPEEHDSFTGSVPREAEDDAEDDLGPSLSQASSVSDVDDDTKLSSLDAELVVDSLPNLYRDASAALSLYDPSNHATITRELRTPASVVGKRFRRYVQQVMSDSNNELFGEDPYIDSRLIARKFGGDAYTDGPWRPDAVIQIRNLCRLLLLLITGTREDIQGDLARLNEAFPSICALQCETGLDPLKHFGTEMAEETFMLALDIRTQFFIAVAEINGQDQFDPELQLHAIFFNDSEQLRNFGRQTGHFSEVEVASIEERIKEIQACFHKSSKPPIKLSKLMDKFSWATVFARAGSWIAQRKNELQAQIASQGGIDAIVDRLRSGDRSSYSESEAHVSVVAGNVAAEQPSPGEQIPPGPKSSRASARVSMSKKVAALRKLKARQAAADELTDRAIGQDQQEIQESPARRQRGEIDPLPDAAEVEDKPLEINTDNDDDEQSSHLVRSDQPLIPRAPPTPLIGNILQLKHKAERRGNKENIESSPKQPRRFVDRQAGAVREVWTESQNVDDGRPRVVPHGRHNDESNGNDDDEDGREDDDFERDNRSLKKPRLSTRAGPRRSLIDEIARDPVPAEPVSEDEADVAEDLRTTEHPSSFSAAAVDPMSPNAQLSASQQYSQANSKAKLETRRRIFAAASTAPRPPQSRRAWTEDEIDRLMTLMSEHGCGWAAIQASDLNHPDGSVLQHRDQVGLKDKARNMKMDYLKARLMLPEGFHDVSLKAKDIDRLDAMGVPHNERRPDGRRHR